METSKDSPNSLTKARSLLALVEQRIKDVTSFVHHWKHTPVIQREENYVSEASSEVPRIPNALDKRRFMTHQQLEESIATTEYIVEEVESSRLGGIEAVKEFMFINPN